MIIQQVIYTPNPNNPNAARLIVQRAKEILGKIPQTTLSVGEAISSDRKVVTSNSKVVKMTSWLNREAMKIYRVHPALTEWCRFVLNGWMVKGSTASDPTTELIEKVLAGGAAFEWERNRTVPEADVVWAGEEITLFAEAGAQVKLPDMDYMIQKLEPIGTGTNANWRSGFCCVFARLARHQYTNDGFATLLSRDLREYLGAAPADLRMTVRLKVPKIVALFVDEAGDREYVSNAVITRL